MIFALLDYERCLALAAMWVVASATLAVLFGRAASLGGDPGEAKVFLSRAIVTPPGVTTEADVCRARR